MTLSVIYNNGRDLLVTKVGGTVLPDTDQGDSKCRRAVDSSS